MNSHGSLNSPPIKEALIDIRVTLPKQIEPSLLNSNYFQKSNCYPKFEEIRQLELQFQLDNSSEVNFAKANAESASTVGYRFISADEQRVVQFRLDGFTFSRIESYSSWNDLKQEAFRLWAVYADCVSPISIARVATRYINLIKFPLQSDLSDYLTTPPKVPKGLHDKFSLSSFLNRIEILEATTGARGFITQVFEPSQEDTINIVLDIDVFITKQFAPNDLQIWDYLDRLRDFKNDVFFENITEKTRKLYS